MFTSLPLLDYNYMKLFFYFQWKRNFSWKAVPSKCPFQTYVLFKMKAYRFISTKLWWCPTKGCGDLRVKSEVRKIWSNSLITFSTYCFFLHANFSQILNRNYLRFFTLNFINYQLPHITASTKKSYHITRPRTKIVHEIWRP